MIENCKNLKVNKKEINSNMFFWIVWRTKKVENSEQKMNIKIFCGRYRKIPELLIQRKDKIQKLGDSIYIRIKRIENNLVMMKIDIK